MMGFVDLGWLTDEELLYQFKLHKGPGYMMQVPYEDSFQFVTFECMEDEVKKRKLKIK